jgi:hypothetical protein
MKRFLLVAVLVLTLVSALMPTSQARPVQAQGGTVWTAAYFNNEYLSGPAAITRQENSIALNWGANAPGPGVNADGFSARFATDVFFNAGTYRFWILADDGVKLWIDFPPDQRATIDTYNAPSPGTTLSADVTLTGGYHHLQIDYRERTGDAYLYFTYANLATNPSGPNFPQPSGPSIPSASWTAQYYSNNALSGSPVVTQTESTPSHNWGQGAPASGVPADNWSARWSSIQNLTAGNYTVSVRADDGVRVLINGTTVINEFHGASGQTYTNSFTLANGQYGIVVEFYDASLDAYLNFTFGPAGSNPNPNPNPNPGPSTGARATVTAYRLNIRNAPSAYTGQILVKVNRNETYAIVGRNTNRSWWQLNVNGTIGWASGAYLNVYDTQNVPVTYNTAPTWTATPSSGGSQCPGFLPSRLWVGGRGRVTPGDPNNLRLQPSLSSAWVGQIPGSGVFDVLGGPVCANYAAWWQVRYNGVVGWTMEGQYSTYWLEPY